MVNLTRNPKETTSKKSISLTGGLQFTEKPNTYLRREEDNLYKKRAEQWMIDQYFSKMFSCGQPTDHER